MAKARPKTAAELCALVESLLAKMPEDQQKRFWGLITEHRDNGHHRKYSALFASLAASAFKEAMKVVTEYHGIIEDQHQQIKKHRRPAKNAERDVEIVKLNADGKTAGSIVLDMKSRYPDLTDKIVNRVISTERKRPTEAD